MHPLGITPAVSPSTPPASRSRRRHTLDGSRPTLSSPTLERVEFRDVAETIRLERTTTIKSFSVDIAGNVERGYRPGTNRNTTRVTVKIRG